MGGIPFYLHTYAQDLHKRTLEDFLADAIVT